MPPTEIPTRAQLFQLGVSVAVQRGALRAPDQRLTRESIETPGSDINIVNAGASFMADAIGQAAADRLGALFLEGATGADLDRLVADRFSPSVVRKQASAAVVPVTLSRIAPGPAVTLDVGTQLRSVSGVEFELVAAVGMSPSDLSATAEIQAITAGTSGNIQQGVALTFVSAPADPTLAAVSSEPGSGGTETESDGSLRARAKDFFTAARRGILAAIEFGAKTVTGVERATAFEHLDPAGLPNGMVSVYIADSNGQGNSVLAAQVRNALLEFRAAGIVVFVIAATPLLVDVQLGLQFRSGFSTQRLFSQVQQAVVFRVNALAPAETLFRSAIVEAIATVQGVIIPSGAVVLPAGDIIPTGGEIIKTSIERVSAT